MTLTSILPLLKILLAFCLMLVGIRLKVGLFFSILAGSLLLALLFGMGPIQWTLAAVEGVTQEKTLFLCAILALILTLSDLLDHCGQANRLLDVLGNHIHRPKLALAFFPALIGLLPMPGGALFSAPMVRTMAARLPGGAEAAGFSPQSQALINYWYRHLWELAWPLYPGIILAASLSGIPLVQLALVLSPAPFLTLLFGWWFVLRPIKLNATPHVPQPKTAFPFRAVLREGLPLGVAIVGAIILEVAIAMLLPEIPFEWGVMLALGLAIITTKIQNRTPLPALLKLFVNRHLLSMLAVVVAIFIFKGVLQVSGAIELLAATAGGDAALLISASFLPFFVGMVSGLNIAFVGAAFPLIIGLLEQMGLQNQLVAYMVLGMFSGYVGVLASPLHLCLILTCQFFKVELSTAWRRLLPPCTCIAVTAFFYFLLLRSWS